MEQAVMRAEAPPTKEHANFFAAKRQSGCAALFYEPPYANELDDALARHLVAYLVPAASLEYKAQVWTTHSRCHFDFLIDLGTRRVAIDYTDTPENVETALVEDNDALVLGTGAVDAILRVRRQDLEDHFYDCLHVIAKWEPNLFTPYGQRRFAERASDDAHGTLPEPESELVTVYYQREEKGKMAFIVNDNAGDDVIEWPDSGDRCDFVAIRRLSGEQPDIWKRQYERAALVYGRDPIRRLHRA